MGTIAELTSKIKAANDLGIENLAKKGVTVPEESTTYEIMGAIDSISVESGEGEYDRGYADGETAGRENQHNDFWDNFQHNGTRTDYNYGFAGGGWNDNNFKPKYDITPTAASYIFANTRITNLKQILIDCGVALDFSKALTGNYPFQNSTITDVGVLDCRLYREFKYFLYGSSSLKNVEKLFIKEDGSQIFDSTYAFGYCRALTHIIFEGAIGSDINFQWSPLNLESAKSVLIALVDYSGTDNNLKYTVCFSSTTTELLTAEGATAPNGVTWFEYAMAKGWNID